MKNVALVSFALMSAIGSAVLPGTASDTNNALFSTVGKVVNLSDDTLFASGVAIGPDLILTAKHVGVGNFELPGVGVFSPITGSQRFTANGDLLLFRINGTLPNWSPVLVDNIVGETVTVVGFGSTGVLRTDGSGYNNIGNAGIRRAAPTTVDFTENVDLGGLGFSQSYLSLLRRAGDAALGSGDSGGGWFVERNGVQYLAGINSFRGTTGTGTNFTFSSDLDNGFYSGAVNLNAYQNFLTTNGVAVVPEPGTMLALTVGLLALRRRRSNR